MTILKRLFITEEISLADDIFREVDELSIDDFIGKLKGYKKLGFSSIRAGGYFGVGSSSFDDTYDLRVIINRLETEEDYNKRVFEYEKELDRLTKLREYWYRKATDYQGNKQLFMINVYSVDKEIAELNLKYEAIDTKEYDGRFNV
jgi:hypothetical protein